MKPRELVQLFVVILVVSVYAYLVATLKASVEGFIGLAMYVVKKFLDMAESEKTPEVKS